LGVFCYSIYGSTYEIPSAALIGFTNFEYEVTEVSKSEISPANPRTPIILRRNFLRQFLGESFNPCAYSSLRNCL